MKRFAGLVTLSLLAWCLLGRQGAEMRSTQASSLHTYATPEATPSRFGPFEVSGAVPVSLVIQNSGKDDRLLSGSTLVASRVELHQTRLVDGRRLMTAAPEGVVIPGGGTLILEPTGSHLMLVDLREDLVQGRTFPLTLHFEHAGEVTVTVRVRRRVDAAGVTPIPTVVAEEFTISLASAPPAPAAP